MEREPTRERPNALYFKGMGKAHVDDATAFMFRCGTIGWAVALLPSYLLVSALLPNAGNIYLALVGVGSFVGWFVGLMVGAFINARKVKASKK